MKIYLTAARCAKGYSIRRLADISGVSASQIERIENGSTNPSVDILCKLAKVLEIPLSDLVCCED